LSAEASAGSRARRRTSDPSSGACPVYGVAINAA
jgi:hypothetical protein